MHAINEWRLVFLPSATSVRRSSSVSTTAVPEAAFFGWTEISDETAAVDLSGAALVLVVLHTGDEACGDEELPGPD